MKLYHTLLPIALTQQNGDDVIDSPPKVISLFDHLQNLDLGVALEHQPSPNGQNDVIDNSNDVTIKTDDYVVIVKSDEVENTTEDDIGDAVGEADDDTVIALKEFATALLSKLFKKTDGISASVKTKANIVPRFGDIIPEPLAMPQSLISLFQSLHSS